MKAQELVSKVQGYAAEKGVAASKACEALNLNARTYYAAVQRLKKGPSVVRTVTVPKGTTKAKRGRPPVAAAKKSVAPAEKAPIAHVTWHPEIAASRSTFLVVGDPSSIAEVARALGAK